jgi:putative membrane protein
VIASARNALFSETAKPFVKSEEGHVTVSCQVFGDYALLSFTLSPKTTEDLPQELGRFVREEARNCGLKDAIVVNAHNSITDTTDLEESLDTLKGVA